MKKVDLYLALRAKMVLEGYDQIGLSIQTGMTTGQISNRMTAKTPWAIEECYAVCDALNIPLTELPQYFPPYGVTQKARKEMTA